MKIYTRTGDAGETSLFDGTRVSKADPRVAAYGDVDELNAFVGLARAGEGIDGEAVEMLIAVQRDLFALGARLADPAHKIADRVTKATIGTAEIERLEQWIDRLEEGLPPLRHFILAGGCPAGATLHLARTVCRRVERAMVALAPPVDAELVRYVNRLSDFLFVLARAVNHRAGVEDVKW
ncbi:MAG: cob(I)yrinic acid a,c-diamide adenosyltransferase [Acidobacteriota bacterium]|nr:cob(I)yrinic acid a,c-diamide adenosyltransferase [Acidobacteriota bacterium]